MSVVVMFCALFMFAVPPIIVFPPTLMSLPIPTPPATCSAPDAVLVEAVVLMKCTRPGDWTVRFVDMSTALAYTDCNLTLLLMFTLPADFAY